MKADNASRELEFKAQEAERQRQHDLSMKKMEYDMKMMEFSMSKQLTLEEVKAKLASDSMKLKTQIHLSNKNGKGPQVASPVVEPAGRAPEGEAYQR